MCLEVGGVNIRSGVCAGTGQAEAEYKDKVSKLQVYSAMLFFAGANDIAQLQSIAREVRRSEIRLYSMTLLKFIDSRFYFSVAVCVTKVYACSKTSM